ncbi:hypothetical protein BHU09_09830 [Tannerella sp. oral taxon 808]|nr:hypothetical protein BHU09_09830 [Tannerella sp. oral taxon 808]
MSARFTLTRRYLRAHVWLHRQCDRLTERQRKYLVFGLCALYFVCSVTMIAQLFLPEEKHEQAIPVSRFADSPIQRDSLHRHVIEPIKT